MLKLYVAKQQGIKLIEIENITNHFLQLVWIDLIDPSDEEEKMFVYLLVEIFHNRG